MNIIHTPFKRVQTAKIKLIESLCTLSYSMTLETKTMKKVQRNQQFVFSNMFYFKHKYQYESYKT